jgi:hypothetical protein
LEDGNAPTVQRKYGGKDGEVPEESRRDGLPQGKTIVGVEAGGAAEPGEPGDGGITVATEEVGDSGIR